MSFMSFRKSHFKHRKGKPNIVVYQKKNRSSEELTLKTLKEKTRAKRPTGLVRVVNTFW